MGEGEGRAEGWGEGSAVGVGVGRKDTVGAYEGGAVAIDMPWVGAFVWSPGDDGICVEISISMPLFQRLPEV